MDFFYQRQSADLSIQSELNLRFAGRGSLASALERYPKLRPPLYPMLLWLAERCGIAALRVNELIFLATLPLLYVLARRSLAGVKPFYPVLLYAAANFNYVNLHQPTAEGLFVFLALVLVLALADELREESRFTLALVVAATAGLGLTRYFAVYFAVPLVLVNVLWLAPGPFPRKLVRVAAALGGALVPLAAWMGIARRETGFWTGVDRLAPRNLPEGAAHWAGLTSFRGNVTLWVKTLVVDFFSPDRYAAHSVVTHPYRPSAIEWALVALAAAALVVGLQAWRRGGEERSRAEGRYERLLVAQAFVLYSAATVATWTFANNDPIYTRFLYPSYVFLVLLGFYAYAYVRRWAASPWGSLAFKLLYAALLVVHCIRDVEAVALPVRYGALYPVRFVL